MPEADQATKNVFGAGVKIHPVTLRPIENGRGALPEAQQVMNHIRDVEATDGEAAADEMRKKLGIKTRSEIAAAEQKATEQKAAADKAAFDAAVEAKAKELIAAAEKK